MSEMSLKIAGDSACDTDIEFVKYGEKKCSKTKLDQLPSAAIDLICLNLKPSDLISLCLCSKSIYGVYHSRLYSKINIMEEKATEPDPDELIIQQHFMNFRDESLELTHWWIDRDESNVNNFKSLLFMMYNVFTKPHVKKFIMNVRIDTKLKPNPFERCNINRSMWDSSLRDVLNTKELQVLKSQIQFPAVNEETTVFTSLLLFLTECQNLQILHVPYFPMSKVYQIVQLPNLASIKEFKMMIYSNDMDYIHIDLGRLKSLKTLRIKFQENTEAALEHISRSLEPVICQLCELQLKYDKTDFNYLTNPTWFSFFKHLKKPMSSLKRLKLKHCFFDNDQVAILDKLMEVVPFSQLTWLSLQIYEYSHNDNEDHRTDSNSISILTPHLNSLKEMWFKPTNDCEECQLNSILGLLKKSKIEKIVLFTNTMNALNYEKLVNELTRMKLNHLSLFDEYINLKLMKQLKIHFQYETGSQIDIFRNYRVETLRQERCTIKHGYMIKSFNEFNEMERNLLSSFWIKYLVELKLIPLIKSSNEVKLFGYNFKYDDGIIKFYISNDIGYVKLMYI